MNERRKEQRVISTFKSAYVKANNGLHFVTLRNISDSGVCFDAYPGVAVGDEIEFCFDSAPLRQGAVKWHENGRFGVSAEPSIVEAESARRAHPSRAVRLPLAFQAQLFTGRGSSIVTAHNLSMRGACIDCTDELQRGQLVSLQFGGLSFELACVRWFDGVQAGISFASPIPRTTFAQLIDKLQNRSLAQSTDQRAFDRVARSETDMETSKVLVMQPA